MSITKNSFSPRQHAETEILEIVGDTVESILAVKGDRNDTLVFAYISFKSVWLRVHLDAGLIFVNVCNGPDEEDDLADGESYLDIAAIFNLHGQEVRKASFENSVFRIRLTSGVELILEPGSDENTAFRVIGP